MTRCWKPLSVLRRRPSARWLRKTMAAFAVGDRPPERGLCPPPSADIGFGRPACSKTPIGAAPEGVVPLPLRVFCARVRWPIGAGVSACAADLRCISAADSREAVLESSALRMCMSGGRRWMGSLLV